MTWRGWHLLVGGAGMLLFVLTGYYMLRVAGVPELPDSERLLYRSSHIYLLLVCVANVYVGYAMPAGVKPGRPQVLCSTVLLSAVPLLAWSFFAEPSSSGLDRPLARSTLFLLFGAPVLLLLHDCYRKLK